MQKNVDLNRTTAMLNRLSQISLRIETVRLVALASAIGLMFFLTSCATNSLSVNVPYGFDLSGKWVLVPGESDEAPDLNAIASKELARETRGKRSDPMSSISFVIQDFPVLVADWLLIEQDDSSMGVEYSNTFYREVSWGKKVINDWKVSSGWSKGDLTLTFKRERVDATERFSLSSRNERLTITVSIKTPIDKMTFSRVYVKR